MSKDVFHFKQFSVSQKHCAMKVSTDACLLGSLAPIINEGNVLDIGTGTGLLSLMTAQRFSNVTISAVEINEACAAQASENFNNSPWRHRLFSYCDDIKNWSAVTSFDSIICNPPFFNQQLRSPQLARNAARHDDGLSKEVLAQTIVRLLKSNGSVVLLWPDTEYDFWKQTAAAHQLYLHHEIAVHSFEDKPANRFISVWKKVVCTDVEKEKLVVYASPYVYSPQVQAAMRAFYTFL